MGEGEGDLPGLAFGDVTSFWVQPPAVRLRPMGERRGRVTDAFGWWSRNTDDHLAPDLQTGTF